MDPKTLSPLPQLVILTPHVLQDPDVEVRDGEWEELQKCAETHCDAHSFGCVVFPQHIVDDKVCIQLDIPDYGFYNYR